jgi:hypothetical protein
MKIDFNKALSVIDIVPGQKRTLTVLFALGMLVCQVGGFHQFTAEEWGAVGVAGGIFYHLKLIRDEKEKTEKKEQEDV